MPGNCRTVYRPVICWLATAAVPSLPSVLARGGGSGCGRHGCGNHGNCVGEHYLSPHRCQCDIGYTGAYCDSPLCPGYVPPGCTQSFPCFDFDFGRGGRSFCADAQQCPHGKPPSELEHFPAQLPGSCMCEAGYTGDLCEERSTPPDTGGTCAAYYEVLPGMGVHTASDMCVVQSLSLP